MKRYNIHLINIGYFSCPAHVVFTLADGSQKEVPELKEGDNFRLDKEIYNNLEINRIRTNSVYMNTYSPPEVYSTSSGASSVLLVIEKVEEIIECQN